MKSKIILTALSALFAWQVNAHAPIAPDTTNSGEIRNQIVQLLEDADLSINKRFSEDVMICFTVGTDGNVEVQRVITGNVALENVVTNQLNDAHIEIAPGNKEQFYWITVKFQVV